MNPSQVGSTQFISPDGEEAGSANLRELHRVWRGLTTDLALGFFGLDPRSNSLMLLSASSWALDWMGKIRSNGQLLEHESLLRGHCLGILSHRLTLASGLYPGAAPLGKPPS